MLFDSNDALQRALREAEERLHAKQDSLESALHLMDTARREVKDARDEVHALRVALAHWLNSRDLSRTSS